MTAPSLAPLTTVAITPYFIQAYCMIKVYPTERKRGSAMTAAVEAEDLRKTFGDVTEPHGPLMEVLTSGPGGAA
jgi:hypothetical protein